MKPEDRQRRVAALVGQEGQISVEALVALFEVSAETIRRDLAQLAESGLVQKVHGGARAVRLHAEGSFDERMAENAEAKQIIARKLAAVIEPGETLFIDTGTTTLACAEALRAVPRLTVATNSARIARSLARGDARVLLLGGRYAFDNDQTVGPETMRQIAEIRADRAILTPAAVDAEAGIMDSDLDEAQVARAMHGHARRTIVVAASAKFLRQAVHRVCRLDRIAALVSEAAPEGDLARALEAAGVEVV
jgi:DeoR/GlpR family transcriptional regulator of sugar metabolism